MNQYQSFKTIKDLKEILDKYPEDTRIYFSNNVSDCFYDLECIFEKRFDHGNRPGGKDKEGLIFEVDG